jgi:hypothetical protein
MENMLFEENNKRVARKLGIQHKKSILPLEEGVSVIACSRVKLKTIKLVFAASPLST